MNRHSGGANALITAMAFLGLAAGPLTTARAQDDAAKAEQMRLAKLLENPVGNLISLPFQYNVDFGIGSAKAARQTLNIQPVIPFSFNTDWNLITRTIVPLIVAESPVAGGQTKRGLGDITQSFFFSPKEPVNGYIVGVGPVLRYPSASDSALGGGKWGAGPTGLVFRQDGTWTYGILVNHLWSVAGKSDRSKLNATFIQPGLAYTLPTATTVSASTEALYDWEAGQWTIPINLNVAQMMKFGNQPVRVLIGVRKYVDKPDGGPDWGMRFQLVFPFPK